MDIVTKFFIALLLIVWLWITLLAIVALVRDELLEPFQRKAQIVLVLIIPLLGALLVLYLVNQHSPEAIPKSFLSWPLKFILFSKSAPKNKNRNEDEESGIDLAISRSHDRRHEIDHISNGD